MNHLSIGHGDVLAHAHNPVLTAVAQMFRRRFAIAKDVGPNGHSVSTVDHHTGSDRLPPKQRGETAGKRIVVDYHACGLLATLHAAPNAHSDRVTALAGCEVIRGDHNVCAESNGHHPWAAAAIRAVCGGGVNSIIGDHKLVVTIGYDAP
jgi:hypothetical protein